MRKTGIQNDVQKTSFENGMKRLEEIISTLERGELDLEESIKYFKEGSQLYQHLQGRLTDVEGEIKIILENAGGTVTTTDYSPE